MNTGMKILRALAMLVFPIAAQAQLTSVDSGMGVYDPTYNVTWTSNANLMATQAANYTNGACGVAGSTACASAFVSTIIADSGGVIHDTPNSFDPSGTYTLSASDFLTNTFFTSTGEMTWWGAQAWVHYLNVIDYGGSNEWALPTTVDNLSLSYGYPDGLAGNPAISSSQMAELFYGDLGLGPGPIADQMHNSAYSLFSNLGNNTYWSGTEYSALPYAAWSYSTESGGQYPSNKVDDFLALAVSPGEVGTPVPLPASAWMMPSGLGALGLAARKG